MALRARLRDDRRVLSPTVGMRAPPYRLAFARAPIPFNRKIKSRSPQGPRPAGLFFFPLQCAASHLPIAFRAAEDKAIAARIWNDGTSGPSHPGRAQEFLDVRIVFYRVARVIDINFAQKVGRLRRPQAGSTCMVLRPSPAKPVHD